MPVQVIFNEYMNDLKEAERKRAVVDRRRVPSTREFAEHIGITPTGFSKITHNQTQSISKRFVAGTITLLRGCGFPTTLTDIIEYVEESGNGGE